MVVKRGGCEGIVEDGGQERWMCRYCRGWWSREVDESIVEDAGQERWM